MSPEKFLDFRETGPWAENRGGKREFQLRVGTEICVFLGLGCEIGKGNRAGYGISIPTWLLSISRPCSSAKTASWRKWTFRAYSCVRFQVMNRNGSEPCQVLSNVSIICLLYVSIRPYEVFESYCDLLFWGNKWVTGLHVLLVWFWRSPRMIALELDFWCNKCII